MNVQIILGQMLMLFAMMLIGYVIWKKNWLDESAYQKLSRIVVNIFNPVLVIYGVAGKSSAGNTGLLLQNLGFVALYFVLKNGAISLQRVEPYEFELPISLDGLELIADALPNYVIDAV